MIFSLQNYHLEVCVSFVSNLGWIDTATHLQAKALPCGTILSTFAEK